jgi:hypothetical protein
MIDVAYGPPFKINRVVNYPKITFSIVSDVPDAHQLVKIPIYEKMFMGNIPNIDPVVWKYMCEPYVIDAGDSGTIPQELVSIIFDDNWYLRPIVQKLIVFVNGPIHNWDENELYDPEGGSIAIDTDGNWRPI